METINELLESLTSKIQHLKSSEERAKSLLDLLKIELKNTRDANLLNAITNTIALGEYGNKSNSIYLTYCIRLLETFLETNEFNLMALEMPRTPNSEKENQKLKDLKVKISQIIIL